MPEALTRNESLLLESIGELAESDRFDVTWEQGELTFPLATFDPLSDGEPELAGVRMSAELKECAPRFVSLSCEWSFASSGRSLDGEFSLPHLYLALVRHAPRHNDLASERDRALLAELRMIDSAPRRATGESAFVRVEPDKDTLEIWYQDRYLFHEEHNTQGFLRMDLSYREYLDTLRLTKGVFGWQMLFVDASLRDPALRPHLASVTTMLETFPSVFPRYDYASLQRRLAARL
jgi:hypothetical protein